MLIHEVKDTPNGIFPHHGIRVEQQDILSRTLPDGDVVGPGETQVVIALYVIDIMKPFRDVIDASVTRVVIDHIHLRLQILDRPVETVKTLVEVMLHIIIYYDYCQFHHSSPISLMHLPMEG